MTAPEFVVVGHVVQDLAPDGWTLGGTASFASLQAKRLGLSVGVVTRASAELNLSRWLPGVEVAGRPSSVTTAFENRYEGGRRRQRVPRRAEGIATEDVPEAWRLTPIVLFGPVAGEVPVSLGTAFAASLSGAAAQGWLRRVDRNGMVRRRAWQGEAFWSGCDAVFVSDEDLGRRRDQAERWAEVVPIVVFTEYVRGACVHEGGGWRRIEAFPADEVDPTGAGDVFAAAFLVRYRETKDTVAAARFAAAAAACSVEAVGLDGIAGREEIEARMARHPQVALR